MNPLLSPGGLRRNAGGLAALLACFLASFAPAQIFTETSQLFGTGGGVELFGLTVAASNDTLLIESGYRDSAYVFVRGSTGWVLQRKFETDGWHGDAAIDGDTLVVHGTVYVRTDGVWTAQQSLPYEYPAAALQGDTLVVGSYYGEGSQQGRVRVYLRTGTTWAEQFTFVPDPGMPDEQRLGEHVDLDGDTLIATVHGAAGPYVYVRAGGTWTRRSRLPRSTGISGRVALEGNTAVVSNPTDERVYIFERTGSVWSLSETLSMPATGGAKYGSIVALDGGILTVGATSMYYVYSKTPYGWVLAQSINLPTFRADGGIAMANGGKLLVLGRASDNYGSALGGMVQTFSVPRPPPPGSGWRDFEIGAVGVAGGSTDNGTSVAVGGSGTDIWDRGDQFHYRTESMTGDGAIIARVNSAGSGHPWAKIGLMARDDIGPMARNVMALVTPGSHLGMQTRMAPAANTDYVDAGWRGAPIWLMLARTGNTFTSYWSDNGESWNAMGYFDNVAMPPTIHVGLAVSSHDNGALATGIFSDIELVNLQQPPIAPPANLTGSIQGGVKVRLQWTDNSADETSFAIYRVAGTGAGDFYQVGSVGANVTEFTDAGLPENTTFTYRILAKRGIDPSEPSNTFTITTTTRPPETLVGADLGAVGVPGAYDNSGGVIIIDASGTDIWENADSGYFAARQVTGDFDVRARVASLTNTHPWAKVGIMAREWSSPGSPNVFALLTADNVAGMQVRGSQGNSTTFTGGPWVNAPYWVRLVRSGSLFTALISPDGIYWQTVGSQSVVLVPDLAVGIAVTSHNNRVTTRATITHLQFGP